MNCFEAFTCEQCCDLETLARGHSRSLKMAPFDRALMFSSNYGCILHQFWHIYRKILRPWN